MPTLSDVTVIDLTQVLAGPYCTMHLADLGADVIRVEPTGTSQRHIGNPMTGDDGSVYVSVNRNKRCVSLDLKAARARQIFLDLVRTADVLVENFRPGVTERLGVGWSTLEAINPGLIYASISGFGQDGPYSARPGYDLIVQGMSGIMSVTGEPDGPPLKCGLPVSDLAAGLFASTAILAALHERARTGRGQRIDVSLLDSALALSVWESAALWSTGTVPTRLGAQHRGSAPYGALRVGDGSIVVGLNNEAFWRAFCEELGLEHLLDDPRFRSNELRLRHRDELLAEIEERLATLSVETILDRLVARGVPAGPIRDYAVALSDEHAQARTMVETIEHPVEGSVRVLGTPMKLGATRGVVHAPAPLHGEHTVEVLLGLGIEMVEILALQEAGELVLRSPPPSPDRS